jgi:hypothetical protein
MLVILETINDLDQTPIKITSRVDFNKIIKSTNDLLSLTYEVKNLFYPHEKTKVLKTTFQFSKAELKAFLLQD